MTTCTKSRPPKKPPIHPGMKVRIPRGTLLRSRHPRKADPYPAQRAQLITVDHLSRGTSFLVGFEYNYSEERKRQGEEDCFCPLLPIHEIADIAQKLGFDGDDPRQDEAATLAFLRTKCERKTQKEKDGLKVVSLWLHYTNPAVCWIGTGGYWIEADIKDVKIEG